MTVETPVQVPPPEVADPLYGHILATMEADLLEMKARALQAEEEVERLQGLETEVASLRESIRQQSEEIATISRNTASVLDHVKAMYNIHNRVFRQ